MSNHVGLCWTIVKALALTLSEWGVTGGFCTEQWSRREKEESTMILKFGFYDWKDGDRELIEMRDAGGKAVWMGPGGEESGSRYTKI